MRKLPSHIVFCWLLAVAICSQPLVAQDDDPIETNILFLLDASQSMSNNWGSKPMFDVAKYLISGTVDSLKGHPGFNFALRVYGHQSHYSIGNCKDSKLEAGFGPYSHILIPSRLNDIRPKGITPLSYALEQAPNDFPSGEDQRNVIIIMTDGKESCEGDPCAVSTELQKKGIVLKPFVIGLGHSTEKYTNLDCVGNYYEAATPEEASTSMNDIMGKISESTTMQVNLLDENGNATETNLNMSFMANNVVKESFYHTLNYRGEPDTIEIDPINNYDIKVHSTPAVYLKDQSFESGEHNVVDIPTPQGSLKVTMPFSNNLYNRNIQVLISKPHSPKTINVQEINATDKYLTGFYDLTILTLPTINLDSVQVRQSHTTEIEIPQPGLLAISNKMELVGGIFTYENSRMVKIANISEHLLKQTILLQPGKYFLVYRKKFALRSEETKVKSFSISSGQSQNLNLD